MTFTTSTPPGKTWIFEQTSTHGHGFWYEAGPGRIDEAGRGLGSVGKLPFKNFTGDILICPPGTVPPGRRSPPPFPLLRYSDKMAALDETPLGVTWGFRHVHPKSGKGYPDTIGIGWFDDEGRARGRFLLRLVAGFKGIVVVCPPGVEPPPGPFAPSVVLHPKGQREDDEGGDDESDADI